MASKQMISDVMADLGRRNKGRVQSDAQKRITLRSLRRAHLVRSLKACRRKGLTMAEAQALPVIRKRLAGVTDLEALWIKSAA